MFQKLFSFLTPAQTTVGLSIGSSSIKLVELKNEKNTWKLLHFGMVQLPEDVVVNREIVNPTAVIDSLKTMLGQIKLKNKSVCTAISGTSLIIKRMTVEVQNMRELQEQVFWEAEQYLPFDIAEVVMDFQVLAQSKEQKVDVLLVAAKKTVVNSYMNAIESSGLKTKILDTDFFALQNIYEINYPAQSGEAVMIVDIGASAMKFIVVHSGIPVFTKEVTLGGSNLTAEIQKQLGLSYTDAETLKTGGQGGTYPQEVSDLMHMMTENFSSEVKKVLDVYSASSSGAPISYILLGGGSSKIPGLSKILEENLSQPTQMMNPFNAISYDPAVFTPEYVAAISPIAAVPLGLALRAGA
ncbi:MAG: type IV pilus assembly protein PilM [Bdellovibrio sp.]|nr:type IV pilus assembly protein PilM [Bdellovibrio sp.]